MWILFHPQRKDGRGVKVKSASKKRRAWLAMFALVKVLASFLGICVCLLLQIGDCQHVVFPVVLVSLSAVALIVSQSVCSCSSCESVSACNYVGESVLACYVLSANGFP